MNEVTIFGYLGRDPELKNTSAGKAYCRFSVATTETWKDTNGTKQSKTEWHNCVAWNSTGENIAKFFKKGSPILLKGKIEYQEGKKDVNGTEIKIMYTSIKVTSFFFTGKSENSGGGYNAPEPTPSGRDAYDGNSDNGSSGSNDEDTIPF